MATPRPRSLAAAALPILMAAACGSESSSTAVARRDAAVGQRLFMRTQTLAPTLGANALACTNCHLEGGRLPGALALTGAAACGSEGSSTAGARRDAAVGQRLFMRTQTLASTLGANALACTNCHLEGGRLPGALALTGAAKAYPRKDAQGREVTLEQRIVRCFTHSLAARAPELESDSVTALAAYVVSIGKPGEGEAADRSLIPQAALIPIRELNAERGRARYGDLCSGCHGLDGQGYRERRKPLPYDYVPPVWGPRSFDDVAGLARVYTLAGFLRHAMPRDDPGTIDDRDAQEIAAFVDGQPRPPYADKTAWDGASPADAVYDTAQYPANPFRVPLAIGP